MDFANGTGTAATGARALVGALGDCPEGAYAELAGLDNGQLARLAKAAGLVKQAAQDELDGRPQR